jgi:transposase
VLSRMGKANTGGTDNAVKRGEITDQAWQQIEPLLPEYGKSGGQWRDQRRRNVVHRCMSRIKQWRGIATRYEKRVVNYRAMVVIASLMIWLPS